MFRWCGFARRPAALFSGEFLTAAHFMIMTLHHHAGKPASKAASWLDKPLDTANHFGVASKDGQVVILRPKCGPMSPGEAANLAKWLHVMSQESTADFARGVKEIRS